MQNQSVSLSQYYQYGSADRNGLRHCRVACNVVAIASLKDLCRTNVLLMDMLFIYNRNYNIFN